MTKKGGFWGEIQKNLLKKYTKKILKLTNFIVLRFVIPNKVNKLITKFVNKFVIVIQNLNKC